MVPPVGAIIIGPCPQCNELVVVFCGHVLALDKETMESGATDDRREHLLSVLTEFLQDRISKLLGDEVDMFDGEPGEEGLLEGDGELRGVASGEESVEVEVSPISQTEFERFTDVDLKLLDNGAYFKSVFEAE